MVGVVVALMLVAAPDAENVGSVDGLNLWAEARAQYQNLNPQMAKPTGSVILGTQFPFDALLAQGLLFAGWGFKPGGQRVVLGVTLGATHVLLEGKDADAFRVPRFFLAPVAVSAAAPMRVGPLVVVPIVSGMASQPDPDSDALAVTARSEVRVRFSMPRLLAGLSLGGSIPTLVTDRRYTATRRCSWPWGCDQYLGRELGRVEVTAQAEAWIWRGLSAGVFVSVSHEVQAHGLESRDPFRPPFAPTVPRSRFTSRVYASWAFVERVGVTIDVAGGSVWTPSLIITAWSTSLSLWFRWDERLQPRWLDH